MARFIDGAIEIFVHDEGVVDVPACCQIDLPSCFGESSRNRFFIITSSRFEPPPKFGIVGRKNEEHVGGGHPITNLNSTLDIDVEHDQVAAGECALDGFAGGAVGVAAENLGVLQKLVPVPHSLERVGCHEEIIFAVDLLVAAGSGGRGYAELPPQFRSYAVHDRGLSNPRRAGNHQQESMISPGRHGGSVENPGR